MASLARVRLPHSPPPGGHSDWDGPEAALLNICPGRDVTDPPSEWIPASGLEPGRHTEEVKPGFICQF